ncbi:triose-phosphate isomerase [Polaribacter sp. R77954]|uniref:triose-phosphate isomerase n=1 Tax=Polaribacter sp. R77954 TaxID=3093870 RepID=UPI0037CB24F7
MRQKIVAGNWKMNNDKQETKTLIEDVKTEIENLSLENTRVIVAPSFVNLESAVNLAEGSSIEVVAQNMHQAKSGAYTGEISADMLKSIGIKSVILGHSERRTYFGETDELLAEKVNAVLENDLETIFCFGELLEDRKSDNHFNVVESQLKNALFHLEAKDWSSIVLAYEPVWAIGTGETASPEQAQEMHAFIRSIVEKQYNKEVADNVSILYGGSVKPANAEEIFSKPDVDGGLIGGAALKASDFSAIIKAI